MKITRNHIRYLLIAAQILIWIGVVSVVHQNRQWAADVLGVIYEPSLLYIVWLCFPFMFLININWYLLAPRYFKKGSYTRYGLYLLGVVLICSFSSLLSVTYNEGNELALIINGPGIKILIPNLLINMYVFSIVYLLSMPFYLSLTWFEQQRKIDTLESANLRTELINLKDQINPHFFFNTLNNLYSLTINNSEKAPEVILKLSELMRYVIYDARRSYVTMQEEITYLESYFEIQKIRLGEKTDAHFDYQLDDPSTPVIPLLFINLLENAFKHGADTMISGGFIHCSLKLNEGKLLFQLRNQYEKTEQKERGVGLDNLKRRLLLAYPNTHRLTIVDENDTFDVSLTIEKMNEVSHS